MPVRIETPLSSSDPARDAHRAGAVLAGAIRAAGLLVGAALILVATPAGAIECTDFPPGNAVNWPDLGAETDIDLTYDSQGMLHAVWLSGSAPAASADVYYASSLDGGQSFGPNVKVNWSDHTAARMTPSIDLDPAGVIYIAWADERAGWPDVDIYFSKSTDGGQLFLRLEGARLEVRYPGSGLADPLLQRL